MDKKPTHDGWRDKERADVRECSECGGFMVARARPHPEDNDLVDIWKEGLGYLQVLLRFCPTCDPNLHEIYPS